MMDVARDQPAKIVGILPRPPATPFVQQKPDAVHVFENPGTLRARRVFRQHARLDLFAPAIRIQPRQLRHLPSIHLWRGETQLLFKRLLQHPDVPVFAEHQRNNDPVISRAHLAVRPAISREFPLPPSRHIRRRPAILFRFLLKRCGLMVDVARGQQFSSPDRRDRFPHEHAIHDDGRASGKILRGEFVFCGNVRL